MKTLNRSALLVLILLGAFVTGCRQVPFMADKPLEFADGTTVEVGDPVYVAPDGKATANAVDPETGKANDPWMATDTGDVGTVTAGTATAASVIPGWGMLAQGVIALGGGGVVAVLKGINDKKLADAGAKPKA